MCKMLSYALFAYIFGLLMGANSPLYSCPNLHNEAVNAQVVKDLPQSLEGWKELIFSHASVAGEGEFFFYEKLLSLKKSSFNAKEWNDLLQFCGEKYFASSNKVDPKSPFRKRGLSRALSLLHRPDLFISSAIESGMSAKEAFAVYQKLVQESFETAPSYTKYEAEQVLDFAKVIQREIKESEMPAEGGTIYIFGSYPNFKAQLYKSDIDVATHHVSGSAAKKILRSAYERFFSEYGEKKPLSLSEDFFLYYHLPLYASFNPIMIKISAEGVFLQVYPMEFVYSRPNQHMQAVEQPMEWKID